MQITVGNVLLPNLEDVLIPRVKNGVQFFIGAIPLFEKFLVSLRSLPATYNLWQPNSSKYLQGVAYLHSRCVDCGLYNAFRRGGRADCVEGQTFEYRNGLHRGGGGLSNSGTFCRTRRTPQANKPGKCLLRIFSNTSSSQLVIPIDIAFTLRILRFPYFEDSKTFANDAQCTALKPSNSLMNHRLTLVTFFDDIWFKMSSKAAADAPSLSSRSPRR